jgi:WD40 repeat protein
LGCWTRLPFPTLAADSFFGKPELQEQMVERNVPTRCAAGVLALRVPDPPSYAPPSVCAISKDGKIAAVGGKDVELYLWSTDSGDLLSTLRGHEIAWTSSNDNTFFVTVQEDSKVMIWAGYKPGGMLTCSMQKISRCGSGGAPRVCTTAQITGVFSIGCTPAGVHLGPA